MKRHAAAGAGIAVLLLGFMGGCRSEPKYGIGQWDAGVYGNHRVVIRVAKKADAVFIRIPWRRRDPDPEKRDLVILAGNSQRRVRNVLRLDINREFGELVFQPESGPGEYHVYTHPYRMEGRSNYPTVTYPEPGPSVDEAWLKQNGLSQDLSENLDNIHRLPKGTILEFQSIDEFNSFYPMEIIATDMEKKLLLEQNPETPFLLFPEDRRYPVRMTRDLPLRWLQKRSTESLRGTADLNEFFAFQIGVYACRTALEDLQVRFHGLSSLSSDFVISEDLFSCFNTGGIDWKGTPFQKSLSVPEGEVQVLWCGIQIPRQAEPGKYQGEVTVMSSGLPPKSIQLRLNVTSRLLEDSGDGEPWRHSRLRWLNSGLGLEASLVSPYTPLRIEDRTIHCLGRSVELNDYGFPKRIQSFFTPEVTSVGGRGQDILSGPVRLMVSDGSGQQLTWEKATMEFNEISETRAEWSSRAQSGPLTMECRSQMEFDGYLDFQVKIRSRTDIRISDIALAVPILKKTARYMLGMGVKGGFRPAGFQWKWDPKHNQDSVWLGDVHAGLQCGFRDDRYSRPLNTNFYLLKPLVMPQSWWNQGKGGCDIREAAKETVQLRAYSGSRDLAEGEVLHYYFSLRITPFRPINPRKQWDTRYYHRYEPLEKIAEAGANTINVHHATEINPFINYPFLRPQKMKKYIDEAHTKGMKVKIYYTVRELTNRAAELFALRSLGDEIFFPGKGGGFAWLQEHLAPDYIAAWFVPDLEDAAVINSGASRWHNYYVEGLNWLVNNVGIDGLYIDDVAFDRTVMQRVRRVLDRGRQGALIDLHSANQYNVRDGFANSANLYMEHFPYIDRLWFGEYFDYNGPPEYWLLEVSGIPFGLMGEMLQDGGNPWRGMLYGMTSRLPWAGDPRPLWKIWDEFNIQESSMIGYWSPSCPIKTGRSDVLATVYAQDGRALISLAGWADREVAVRLQIDWAALGIDPKRASLFAPFIPDFQEEAHFASGDRIPIPAGRGWLLTLSQDGQ